MDALARIIFPEVQPSMRRKHLRFLMLSLALGLLFCSLLVWILWLAQNRGR